YVGIQMMFINSKGSTLTLDLKRVNDEGLLAISTNGQYAVPSRDTNLADKIALDSWIDLRIEYYHNGASAATNTTFMKLWVNDTLVYDGAAYYSGSNLKAEITAFKISHYRNGGSTIYYDDLCFTCTDKEYVASTAN
ncbi:MAG: hypothetical protein IKU91_04495, partial [Anaerotignum sp.]|nr:hypothetical protein [Anaerotignum sp.]